MACGELSESWFAGHRSHGPIEKTIAGQLGNSSCVPELSQNYPELARRLDCWEASLEDFSAEHR